MTPKFYDSRGRLTAYALACGYLESVILSHAGAVVGKQLKLWNEHGVYHVRLHNFSTGKADFWDSFRHLKSARQRYSKARQEASNA